MANTRRYREYDLAHLKLVFEFSIYKVWKSVGYGAHDTVSSHDGIQRIALQNRNFKVSSFKLQNARLLLNVFDVSETVGFAKVQSEVFQLHKRGPFCSGVRAPRIQDNKNKERLKKKCASWKHLLPRFGVMYGLGGMTRVVRHGRAYLCTLAFHFNSSPYKNFMPSTPDLSFTGLDEFVNKPVVENYKAMSSEEEPKVRYESNGECRLRKETKPIKNYILLPLWTADPPFSQDPKSSHDDGSKPSSDNGKKVDEDPRKESECNDQEKEDNVNNTNNVNAASTNKVNAISEKTSIELPFDPNMPALEDYRDDEDDGAEADMNNLDTTIQVSPIPTTRIHKDHPLDQVIGDLQSATQTRLATQTRNHVNEFEGTWVC
ncbi:hypothetical protein Tco_0322811 [Tanacetum coccineum]